MGIIWLEPVGCKVAAMDEKDLQETTSILGSQERFTNMGIIATDKTKAD